MDKALPKWQTVRRLLLTTGTEGITQFFAAVAGFLIVHHLAKDVYAEYTFLVTCGTLLVGLSDLGLSHSYLPIVGSRAGDTSWVVNSCSHVYRKRWNLLLPAAIVIVPYWLVISLRHQWVNTAYLVAAAGSAVGVALLLREQLSRTAMSIIRQVERLNRIGITGAVVRLALVALVLSFVPDWALLPALTLTAAIASAVLIAQFGRVPQLAGLGHGALSGVQAREVDDRVKAIVAPLVLPVLFYQFQGTITILLVSLVGAKTAIAEVGALTRPALILTITDRVTSVLLFPAIARHPAGASLKNLIVKSHLLYLAAMLALLATAVFLPQYWMLLIGEQYAAQQGLLWMAFVSAILMNAAGFAFTTLSARGLTSGQVYLIPLVLAAQCGYLLFFDVGTTREALLFGIVSAVVFFLFQYSSMFVRLLLPRNP